MVVLSVFCGLLSWGHHHNWKVPSFSALTGREAQAATSSGPGTEVTAVPTGEARYRIQLATPHALGKAGIETSPLYERPLTQTITANGVLDYDQTRFADVGPCAGGTVWMVLKQEGDRVEAGDILALVASPDVVKAKTDYLQALLQVEAGDRTVKRLRATGDTVADQQVRDAERGLREARIRLFDVQQQLVNLGLTVRPDTLLGAAEDQLAERLRTAGLPAAVLRDLNHATLPNNLLPLYAPFAGQVVQRAATVGELVKPAQVLFAVADLRRLWIQLDVRLEDADQISPGQEITFRPDGAAARQPRGRVSWVSPGVDKKTRAVRVRAEVSNPDGDLRPDTFGTGRIVVRSSRQSLAVPTTAIQRDGDDHLVFVRVGTTAFEGRRVELGMWDEQYSEVRSGLKAGESVVVAGSHVLKSEILRSRLTGGD